VECAAVGTHARARLHGVVGVAAQAGDLALDVGIAIVTARQGSPHGQANGGKRQCDG
jgi:hypothetical protein